MVVVFRAVDSLSLPVGQDKNIPSIFPHFPVVSLIFPQNFFICFLILVFWVGGSPTREGPATPLVVLHLKYAFMYFMNKLIIYNMHGLFNSVENKL